MTATRLLLSTQVALILGPACLGKERDVVCMRVAASAECPTVAEVEAMAAEDSGISACGTLNLREGVRSFAERHETLECFGGPLVEDRDEAECCYNVVQSVGGTGDKDGRPLVVDGLARVASDRRGPSPWSSGPTPVVAGLRPAQRQALAAAWLQAARFEHASIASFARAAAELMAHGAPPALLLGVMRAGADEVAHAQLSLALASAYAGVPFAPGQLEPAPPRTQTLADLAVAAFLEGAVGESLATVLAAHRLRHATDPAVRSALTRIVADEAQHAELAWATLRWCCQEGGDAVRRALEDARAALPVPDASRHPVEGVPAHGLLGRAAVARALAEGIVQVVTPALASVLSTAAGDA